MIIPKIQEISGQDPLAFAWHRLRLFRNPEFAATHLIRLHAIPAIHHKNAERQATEIRYCLIQAEEYLNSARSASLATRPLLLYYGLMSFSLAEVLVKNSGDSRLARLREKHASHGLSLLVNGDLGIRVPFIEILKRLRSAPQFRKTGSAYGTFEAWRQGVREPPVAAQGTRHHVGGTRTVGMELLLPGDDISPPASPSTGYVLLDALRGIPQLAGLLQHLDIPPTVVRFKLSKEVDVNKLNGNVTLVMHPGPDAPFQAMLQKMYFDAGAVNTLRITEMPSGIAILMPLENGVLPGHLTMPPAITLSSERLVAVTDDWHLGEFGSYYIALHIFGNLARYYPEIWMHHVDRSSSFALLVQEVCDLADQRLPLLVAGELDRCYYFPSD